MVPFGPDLEHLGCINVFCMSFLGVWGLTTMKNNVFLFAFVVSGHLISDLGPQGGIGGRPKLKLIHGSAVSRIYYMIFFTCFFGP